MTGKTAASREKPFSLGFYLLVVFALSWPFQIASAVWGDSLLPRYVLNASSMIMVGVGTFLAGSFIFRDGFRGAGWRWGRPGQYLAVIVLVLILWAVPALIDLARGKLTLPANIDGGHIAWIFVLLFVTLIPAFGEEIGWRGYLIPRLTRRFSPRKAVVLHAFIWYAWHIPLLIDNAYATAPEIASRMGISPAAATAINSALILTIGAVPGILHGILIAYIWQRTRSLAVATVYHAAYDGVRDSLQITFGPSPLGSAWAVLLLMTLAVIALARGNWDNLTRG